MSLTRLTRASTFAGPVSALVSGGSFRRRGVVLSLTLSLLLCLFLASTGTAFASESAPTMGLYAAIGVEQTTATLYGYINPGGLDTTYSFVYKAIPGDDPSSCTEADLQGGTHTRAEVFPGANQPNNVAVRPTSFLPDTVYCYGLEASNSDGPGTYELGGPTVEGFETLPSVPVVTLSQSPTREPGTISLTGTVNTEGSPTSYTFSYGVNRNCTEETVSAPVSLPESNTAQSVSTTISNLQTGEYYCVELTATNAVGESAPYSATYEFIEQGSPPVIGPATVSSTTQTTASIATTINPEVTTPRKSVPAGYEATYTIETAASCEASFETSPLTYSTFLAYLPESEVSQLITPAPVEINLTHLMPNTSYCVLLEAFNYSGDTADPTTLQFTTLAASTTTSTPVTTPTPTPVPLPSTPELVSPINTAVPSIRGRAISGGKLQAVNGRWSGATPLRYTYQWQRCNHAGRRCVVIKGATKSVLELTARDVRDRLGVIVTAHNSAGSTRKLSALTAAVETKA